MSETINVLSLSYGKDSLACIGACDKLGVKIDRIIHAEVWATQDIPADLPPMVEFKKKADKIIKERWGIEVEHLCAMQKDPFAMREKEDSRTKKCSTQNWKAESTKASVDSLKPSDLGAKNLNTKKLTYEDIFYRPMKPRKLGGSCEI